MRLLKLLLTYWMVLMFAVPLQARPICQELFVITEKVVWQDQLPYVLDLKQVFASKKILIDQELQQAVITDLVNKGIQNPKLWPQFKSRARQLIRSNLLDLSMTTASLYLTVTTGALPILPELKTIKLDREEIKQLIIQGMHSEYAQNLAKKYEQNLNRRVKYTKIKAYFNMLSFVVIASIISQMIYEEELKEEAAQEELKQIRSDLKEIKERAIRTRADIEFEIGMKKLSKKLKTEPNESLRAILCTRIDSPLYCSH